MDDATEPTPRSAAPPADTSAESPPAPPVETHDAPAHKEYYPGMEWETGCNRSF